MSFDVEPTRVGRGRPRLQVVAVLAAAFALVAIAVATSAHGPDPVVAPLPSAGVALAATPSPSEPRNDSNPGLLVPPLRPSSSPSGASIGSGPLYLPRALTCHGVVASTCRRIAVAVVAALPPDVPRVASVEAWASILCADDLDCPRTVLADAIPLGSAIVSFTDGGPRAWVNVVAPSVVASESGRSGRAVAWVVRWQP